MDAEVKVEFIKRTRKAQKEISEIKRIMVPNITAFKHKTTMENDLQNAINSLESFVDGMLEGEFKK